MATYPATCIQYTLASPKRSKAQRNVQQTEDMTSTPSTSDMRVQHTSAPADRNTKRKKEQPLSSRSTKRIRTAEGRRNTNTEAPKRLRKDNVEEGNELKHTRSESNKNDIRINVGDNNGTTTSTSTGGASTGPRTILPPPFERKFARMCSS